MYISSNTFPAFVIDETFAIDGYFDYMDQYQV